MADAGFIGFGFYNQFYGNVDVIGVAAFAIANSYQLVAILAGEVFCASVVLFWCFLNFHVVSLLMLSCCVSGLPI